MPLGIEQIGRAFAKRSQRGLYAGRRVLFGNKISEDGGNKSRRKWLPNVQKKHMWSDMLDKMVQIRMATGAMRNIDKAGGLDSYVYKIQGSHEDSEMAQKLRSQLDQIKLARAEASNPSPPPKKKIAQPQKARKQPKAEPHRPTLMPIGRE